MLSVVRTHPPPPTAFSNSIRPDSPPFTRAFPTALHAASCAPMERDAIRCRCYGAHRGRASGARVSRGIDRSVREPRGSADLPAHRPQLLRLPPQVPVGAVLQRRGRRSGGRAGTKTGQRMVPIRASLYRRLRAYIEGKTGRPAISSSVPSIGSITKQTSASSSSRGEAGVSSLRIAAESIRSWMAAGELALDFEVDVGHGLSAAIAGLVAEEMHAPFNDCSALVQRRPQPIQGECARTAHAAYQPTEVAIRSWSPSS